MVDSTNLPDVDINQIATDLNNKMDRDGVNATASVCVESYHDENGNWYRVYSDGWCEQGGGFGPEFVSYTSKTVNFLKPFRDTNYSAFEMQGHTNSLECASISNKTTGSITFGGVYNRGSLACWRAEGYIR